MSRNRIDRPCTWLAVSYSFVPCQRVSARGQPWRILRFTLTTLSSIGAVGRHSWQSFGFAGGIVRALASVLPESATLLGYTQVTLRVSSVTLSVS